MQRRLTTILCRAQRNPLKQKKKKRENQPLSNIMSSSAIINQMQNEILDTDIIEMKNIHLTKMDCDLIPFYSTKGKNIFPFWVELEKLD